MTRPFETDYAGVWRGHCKTREGAIMAATKHIVRDGYTACVITDKRTGMFVARVTMDKSRRTILIETQRQMRRVQTI